MQLEERSRARYQRPPHNPDGLMHLKADVLGCYSLFFFSSRNVHPQNAGRRTFGKIDVCVKYGHSSSCRRYGIWSMGGTRKIASYFSSPIKFRERVAYLAHLERIYALIKCISEKFFRNNTHTHTRTHFAETF